MALNILVVEDQKDIADVITRYLDKEGHHYAVAQDGLGALSLFADKPFDVVLLDVMLPDIDGFEVLGEIRKISDVPVMMITARIDEADRIKGFDKGADDYILKPFSPRELMKRIKAVAKRVYKDSSGDVLDSGPFMLNTRNMELKKNNRLIPITASEYQLIRVFIQNKGIVLTREQLIRLAFGHSYEGFDRNIDTYIKRIRQKIEDDPQNPIFLLTRYGAGYIFEE